MNRILTIMAKAPVSGDVKTRLCPPLDIDAAARLHECFLLDTIDKVRAVPDSQLAVAYSPSSALDYFRTSAPDATVFVEQEGDDLGARMLNCFKQLCGPENAVVMIGADSPSLPVEYMEQAFDVLESQEADAVFGPSDDGGYYLIGMTFPHSALFRDIGWSTSQVLRESLERCDELGLKSFLLPPWYDVDGPDDLARLVNELRFHKGLRAEIPRTFKQVSGLKFQVKGD